MNDKVLQFTTLVAAMGIAACGGTIDETDGTGSSGVAASSDDAASECEARGHTCAALAGGPCPSGEVEVDAACGLAELTCCAPVADVEGEAGERPRPPAPGEPEGEEARGGAGDDGGEGPAPGGSGDDEGEGPAPGGGGDDGGEGPAPGGGGDDEGEGPAPGGGGDDGGEGGGSSGPEAGGE